MAFVFKDNAGSISVEIWTNIQITKREMRYRTGEGNRYLLKERNIREKNRAQLKRAIADGVRS